MPSTLILLGLGNPGPRYEWTRHNFGFHVLDDLASRHHARWAEESASYLRADCRIEDKALVLVKPRTYVNRSGRALLALRNHTEFDPGEVLAVVDDIALTWGRLRLRRGGSDGGHNGLRSIIDSLGTTAFPRLRIGVGPVPPDADPADFVLETIFHDLRKAAGEVSQRAMACIEDVVSGGFDRAMSLYNSAEPESD